MTNKTQSSKTVNGKTVNGKKRYQDLLKRKLERCAGEAKQDKSPSPKQNKTESLNPMDHEAQSLDLLCPEFPELDKILQMPKHTKEHAFVRAVCSAFKAKRKAIKKLKQSMAWLRMENKN